MSEMRRISFDDVARELGADVPPRGGPGGPGGKGPGGPGGGPGGPNGAGGGRPPAPPSGGFTPEMSRQSSMRLAKMWPVERALKLTDYFAEAKRTKEPLEFEGHPACWAMMMLVDYLKDNELYMYMPPFQKSLKLEAFSIGDKPVEGQLSTFTLEEKGNDVHLTATLNNGGNPDPFAIPYHENVAPAIAAGKNIYVELVGAHYIAVFSLPWTYPDCNAMFMKMADGTYCVMSHTPEYKVGQIVEFPF